MTPAEMVWGAGTSAYQIEGATREGGRGESIWDRFATVPGKIADGSSGEPAADHYNRIHADVVLMRELGLRAYRFSIAWPRIQPEGRGRANPAGIDFYERLVDLLLENEIRPFATLFHWDLPQAIQDRGGWARRDTIERFVEYADIVAYRLGDRVHDWITVNEPSIVAQLGHGAAEHAPGLANPALYPRVAHHLLLAHGSAVPVVRGHVRGGAAAVGIALNVSPVEPASPHDEDERAAQIRDGVLNRWYLDALFKGAYPADIAARLPLLEIESGEMETIATPVDFLGVNYYTREVVTMGPGDEPQSASPRGENGEEEHYERTAMGWEVYPRGLYEALTRVARDYNPSALYVTENGAAFDDEVGLGGAVRDPRRRAYLEGHMEQALRAAADGVPLRGYFAWSLLDNWEWALGYTRRFGLIHVDYATQTRTIKESGQWYARFIAGEGTQ